MTVSDGTFHNAGTLAAGWSGTISGPEPGSEGSLIELYANTRFLADGDEVVLRADRLGEVRGRVRPA